MFDSIVNKAGVPRLRFHDLRHSAATLQSVQGVDPRVVMELLRHTDFKTTMDLYSHVIPTLKSDAAEHMDRILDPVVVKEGESQIEEDANLKKTVDRGEWIRTTDLPVPNLHLSTHYKRVPLSR